VSDPLYTDGVSTITRDPDDPQGVVITGTLDRVILPTLQRIIADRVDHDAALILDLSAVDFVDLQAARYLTSHELSHVALRAPSRAVKRAVGILNEITG
jgi:anti-anti-sigma regulatory factor